MDDPSARPPSDARPDRQQQASHRSDEHPGKVFHTLGLPDLGAWPQAASLPSGGFGLFLACDVEALPVDILSLAARAMLRSGAAYICVWGPGCERFHDIIDEEHVWQHVNGLDQPDIVTTWHAQESLDQALWFFVDVAQLPHEPLVDWVAVAVGRAFWFSQV